jgi:hypothetical protein
VIKQTREMVLGVCLFAGPKGVHSIAINIFPFSNRFIHTHTKKRRAGKNPKILNLLSLQQTNKIGNTKKILRQKETPRKNFDILRVKIFLQKPFKCISDEGILR